MILRTLLAATVAAASFGCITPQPRDGPRGYANGEQSPPPPGTAPVEIDFEDAMSSTYVLGEALVAMDGKVFYRLDDPPLSAPQRTFPVFDGSVDPGDHVIAVTIRYHGNERFWNYRGYTFTIKSSHRFRAVADAKVRVDIRGYEEGTESTPLEQRPKIAWHESGGTGIGGQASPPSGDASSGDAAENGSGSSAPLPDAGANAFSL